MIAHSTSKRNARKVAVPQVESTVLIEYTDAPIIKCKARADIALVNVFVRKNTTMFLVKSARRANRYYIVAFNESRGAYQCSCGCNMCEHEHLKTVRNFVMDTVVKPVNPDAPEMSVPASVKEVKSARKASKSATKVETASEVDGSRKLTASEWRAIQKADRARQQGYAKEYRQEAEALRKETA